MIFGPQIEPLPEIGQIHSASGAYTQAVASIQEKYDRLYAQATEGTPGTFWTIWPKLVAAAPDFKLITTRRHELVIHRASGIQLGAWPRDRHLGDVIMSALASVWKGIKTGPGLFGLALGVALPFTGLSLTTKLGISAAIGVGGYASPEGSWFRKFSIGAGIGGAIGSGIQLYELYKQWPTWDQVGQAALAVPISVADTVGAGAALPFAFGQSVYDITKSGLTAGVPF